MVKNHIERVRTHLPRLMSALNRSHASLVGCCRTFHFQSEAQLVDLPSALGPARHVAPSPHHFGYSHSRRSSLLQHQPGCQRSQNPLAKRNNKTTPLILVWKILPVPQAALPPPLSQTTSRRNHSKLHRGFKQSLGHWLKIPALHLIPPQMLWHSYVWGHHSP